VYRSLSLVACLVAVLFPTVLWAADAQDPQPDAGDTAWMLVSTGLVLVMVPGLALFYGGMVRRKNVLGTMMQSMVALALIGIQWLAFGYALSFGDSQGGLIGWSSSYLGLTGVKPSDLFVGTKIPVYLHCAYQGMFAIITPALISGAIAERVRFGPYCLFILLWGVFVYDPLAHWVWAAAPKPGDPTASIPAGWLGKFGALDFAGGTVVHIAAGFSSLAAILLLPKRRGYPEHAMHPNSMVFTLTGAGLLWFGWFGFNGGSALGANRQAVVALTGSQMAAAAAALSWLLIEWLHRGKPTALGLASGVVAGLVAITPASGYVSPLSGMIIGILAGGVCYASVSLKPVWKYDDSLDAFGVHGVGGFLGALLTGLFASKLLVNQAQGNTDAVGVLETGTELAAQMKVQFVAALVSAAYSFLVTCVLVKVIDGVWGFNLEARDENEGLDRAAHGEVGFDLGLALEAIAEKPSLEPRPASVPPNGKRHFTIVVEGVPDKELIHAWSELCQTSATPPAPEFRMVYPYVTTVQRNRFNFRGGDPSLMRENLERLFQKRLEGSPIRTHVEG
jgi:Amt family ammonium transporter